jgi:hypothetical protein
MTIHIREGSPDDRDAILRLRELVFATEDPEKRRPDFWEWEFVKGYAGPGRYFVAENGTQLVGHLGFVPQKYWAGQTVNGVLTVDAMTHPDFRGQRVFARLNQFAADAMRPDTQFALAFQIRKQVLPGFLTAGYRKTISVPILLKPLLGSGGVEKVKSEGPIPFDHLLETPATRQKRSGDFLRWRYRSNPHWRFEMHSVDEGKEQKAFVVHRQTTLRGRRTLAIADAGVSPGHDETLEQLLKMVCAGRGKGVGLAAALISRDHPAYRALRKCGFFPGPHRFRLMVQVLDEKVRWLERTPWSVSWGDTDHL